MSKTEDKALELFEIFKQRTIEHLIEREDKDEMLIHCGNQSFSKSQIADEIKSGGDFGMRILCNLINLSIDLVSRNRARIEFDRIDEISQLREALRKAIELLQEHEDGYMYLNIHDWIHEAEQLFTRKEDKA